MRQELAAAEQYLAEHRQATAREAELTPDQAVAEVKPRGSVVHAEIDPEF